MALQDLTPQLRTRLRRVEAIVGLFVLVATLGLIAGFGYYLYHTAERKGWFTPKCPCYTYVASAEGLKVGDPIMLMGFNVGEIKTITAQPAGSIDKVFIGFEVKSPYYGYIYTDTRVDIAAGGFLGGRQVELTAHYAGQPVVHERNGRVAEILYNGKRLLLADAPKGVFLPANENPPLTARLEKIMDQVQSALPGVMDLTNQLAATLASATATLTNLNQTMVQLQPTLTNLAVITGNLRDPHGSLGEWVVPPGMNTNLTETLEHLASITSNLNLQVQSNDQMLAGLSKLVIDTDNLVQGLKKHWLLRGAFQKMNATNTPAARPQTIPPK
jgi:ABC-type transporter Mla subunit MlaD